MGGGAIPAANSLDRATHLSKSSAAMVLQVTMTHIKDLSHQHYVPAPVVRLHDMVQPKLEDV